MSAEPDDVSGRPERGAGESDRGAAESDRGPGESEWRRRKRLAAVFGDVLPETTSDEPTGEDGTSEDWYRAQRPPHHGD